MNKPTLNPRSKQVYRFRLVAFKKNDHDLELAIAAPSIMSAWSEARRRAFGFPYYLKAIETPTKKTAPTDCPQAQT